MLKKSAFLTTFLLVIFLAGKTQDSTACAEYFGKYIFDAGSPVSEVEIVWMDAGLNVTSAMGNATMTKAGLDSFNMSYEDGLIVFSRDSVTQKITGLTIYVTGMALNAKKAEENKAVGFMSTPAKKEESASMN